MSDNNIEVKPAQTDECPNVAVLKINSSRFIMELPDALAVVSLLRGARKYDYDYISGAGRKYHVGGTLPEILVEMVTRDVLIEGLINGEKTR